LFVFLFSASSLSSSDSPEYKSPAFLKAVQVSVLEFQSPGELEQWLLELKNAGVNAIILRVFQNPGDRFHSLCVPTVDKGVYFKSQIAPTVCDLLDSVCQKAHQLGLKIYAWMTTRSADYGIDNKQFYSWYYDFSSQRYKLSDRLCLFHPEVRTYLKSLYLELAHYPIDGILIQDDLMLKHNEDFHPFARSLYQQEKGAQAHPFLFYQIGVKNGKRKFKGYREEFWDWSQWKAEELAQFARELKNSVKKINPQIKLGMNLYYETALKPHYGLAWFGLDLEVLKKAGLDFYCLMLYHRQMKSELGLNQEGLEKALKTSSQNFFQMIPSPAEPVIKLMTRDFQSKKEIPFSELWQVIKLVNFQPGAGLVFFPAFPLGSEIPELVFQAWEEGNDN